MTSAIIILLDGIAYGMVLFIISVGLTVTMGLMRVVNLAHGGFAMAGGYLAAVMVVAGVPFIVAVIAATAAAGLLGALCELTVFRPLYRKGELAQVLMTFGLTFVMIAALTAMFGTDIKRLPVPDWLGGLVDLGFRLYPTYRLFLIAVGLILALALWLIIDRSLYGAKLARRGRQSAHRARGRHRCEQTIHDHLRRRLRAGRLWRHRSAPRCCRSSRSTRCAISCCSWSWSRSAGTAASRARSSPR